MYVCQIFVPRSSNGAAVSHVSFKSCHVESRTTNMSMDRATLIAKIDELGSVAASALEPTAADRDRFMQQAGAFANHLVGKHDAEFVHTCFATKPAPLPAPSEKPTNDRPHRAAERSGAFRS
jgi:hypothetical protein